MRNGAPGASIGVTGRVAPRLLVSQRWVSTCSMIPGLSSPPMESTTRWYSVFQMSRSLWKKLSAQTQKFLSCSLVGAGLRWHHSRQLHLCFESQRWDSYQEMASDVTCTGLSVRRHLHSLVYIYTAFVGKQHIYLLVWENSSLPGVSRSGGSKNQNRDW